MEVVVRSSDPAPGSRAFPWPVLEAGNDSYPDGRYRIEIVHRVRGRSFEVGHTVAGAPLLERWIAAGAVRFACAVASPVSAYRKLHIGPDARQSVEWDPDDLGSYPMFTPMIVCNERLTHRISSRQDGVNELWDDVQVEIEKGSRVAVCSTFALQSGLLGLLDFRCENDLEAGEFKVEPNREYGFRFRVDLAPDLHGYLHSEFNRERPAGWNIMGHVVSAALSCLRKEFSEDDGDEGWESYSNLRALAHTLEQRGLPHWAEDDFRPERVATRLFPHKIEDEDAP